MPPANQAKAPPPPFVVPPDTELPPIYPYTKLTNPNAPTPSSSNPNPKPTGAGSASTSNPASRPGATPTSAGSTPGEASTAAAASGQSRTPLSYGFGGRAEMSKPFSYSSPASMSSRPAAESASASNSASSAHTQGLAHHHHHHHHVHPQSSSSTPAPGSTASAAATASAGAGGPASASTVGGQRRDGPTSAPPVSTGYRPFASSFGFGLSAAFREAELREREKMHAKEREMREKALEQERERAKQQQQQQQQQPQSAAANKVETSPRTAAVSPYARSTLTTSPITGRSQPLSVPPNSKPSVSPQPFPATAGSTSSTRPTLPVPSFLSGARSLPSPFDAQGRDRPGSASTQADTSNAQLGHQRSLSGSGNRADAAMISPKTAAGGQTPSLGVQGRPSASASPHPPTRETATSPSSVTRPVTSISSTTGQTQAQAGAQPSQQAGQTVAQTQASADAQVSRDYYSRFGLTQPSRPYVPFGGPYHAFSSFGSWSERERQREREAREREARLKRENDERQKLQAERVERERAWMREKERNAQLQQQREMERRAAARNMTGPGASASANASTSGDVKPVSGVGDLATGTGRSWLDPYRQEAKPETDTALQQVAPQREPRPYGYKTEPRDSPVTQPLSQPAYPVQPAASQTARDHQYQPRETAKRPRMDAAVDEARRGGHSKSKRRKEEDPLVSNARDGSREKDKARSPGLRDFTGLTTAVKKYPEVTSAAIETWLKNLASPSGEYPPKPAFSLTHITGGEIYTGSTWRVCNLAKNYAPGSLIEVRIGGGFLGKGWKVRGEPGWEEATLPLGADRSAWESLGEVARGWKDRSVWGTDVYTDDSDLGLVMIHAGWIRWSANSSDGQVEDSNGDAGPAGSGKRVAPGGKSKKPDWAVVNVRIAPPLVRYTATERNGLVSRGWGNGHDGASIVVEAIRREGIAPTTLSSIKRRKLRLAHQAIERAHVLDLEPASDRALAAQSTEEERLPLSEERRRVNGVYNLVQMEEEVHGEYQYGEERGLIWGRGGPGFKYSCVAMDSWLARSDDEDEQPDSLWTCDLELESGSDRYRLSLLPSSVTNPRLHLYQTPIPLPHPNDRNGSADAKSKSLDELKSENDRKVIVPDLPAAHFHWVHDGLVVRTAGRKGVLCKVERYRWKKREMQWGVQTISVTEQSESEIPDGPM